MVIESHNGIKVCANKSRLMFLIMIFVLGFIIIASCMTILAAGGRVNTTNSITSNSQILNKRAIIVDRNGWILATNLITQALYANPLQMINPIVAADSVVDIFPDLDKSYLQRQFINGNRKFIWLRRNISPEQRQAVHDLGEPGLLFAHREMRLYPNKRLAAHVLGGVNFDDETVHGVRLVGIAGVEKYFDQWLSNPLHKDEVLELSIDLSVQATMQYILRGGMELMNAKGAAAVLLDVDTGEIIGMVSLPDFDPNKYSQIKAAKDQSLNLFFNRAVQGVYELGSTFKVFTMINVLNSNKFTSDSVIALGGPIKYGRYQIADSYNLGSNLTVEDILVKSSNIGIARLALMFGSDAQKRLLRSLGFFTPTKLELTEAINAQPLLPKRWGELETMTVSYGHGIAVSLVHLASAYASIANGGYRVEPSLLRKSKGEINRLRVMPNSTSIALRKILRKVVLNGTASIANLANYSIAGKTGTADKPNPKGGYYKDRVIATFSAFFPATKPRYVLVVSLDEPHRVVLGKKRRTAGWTAVPVASEIISRVAPILGLKSDLLANK